MEELTAYEIEVTYNGNSYLCIYGNHINGAFIAIPNWNIATELSSYLEDNVNYNANKIAEAFANTYNYDNDSAYEVGKHIAKSLKWQD